MKVIVIICLNFYFLNYCISQVPIIQWEKTYGGSMSDYGYSICKTYDGCYLIAGSTESNDGDISFFHGANDFWLIKIDSLGTIIWEKTYGGSSSEEPTTVFQTFDHGFIIYGQTNSEDGDVSGLHEDSIFPSPQHDGWLLKIDSIGQIEWQHCYGGTENDWGKDLIITPDSNYLLATEIESSDGDITAFYGITDYWFVKTDQSGSILWQRTFGGTDREYPNCCTAVNDSVYLIAGNTHFDFGGFHGSNISSDMGIVKVNSNGNVLWSHCYGAAIGGELPYSLLPTANSGFIAVSEITSSGDDITQFYGGSDIWIFKADSTGGILWDKTYGGSGGDRPLKVIRTSDGGFVIAGYTLSNDIWVSNFHGLFDSWVIKLDSLGNFEWGKTLGGTNWDEAFSILETSDGGYIVCGFTESTDGDVNMNHGNADLWVVKLSSTTDIPEIKNQLMDFTATQIQNQFKFQFFFKHKTTATCSILDLNGKKLFEENIIINEGINYQNIPCGSLSSGMYFISMDGKDIFAREKVVKQ